MAHPANFVYFCPPCVYAWFTKHMQDEIKRYDGALETPVVVIGYSVIRRSLSVRSDLRVPTHMILRVGKSMPLAEIIQMFGRAFGRNRKCLNDNGFDKVTVLAQQEDYGAVKVYEAFMAELLE